MTERPPTTSHGSDAAALFYDESIGAEEKLIRLNAMADAAPEGSYRRTEAMGYVRAVHMRASARRSAAESGRV